MSCIALTPNPFTQYVNAIYLKSHNEFCYGVTDIRPDNQPPFYSYAHLTEYRVLGIDPSNASYGLKPDIAFCIDRLKNTYPHLNKVWLEVLWYVETSDGTVYTPLQALIEPCISSTTKAQGEGGAWVVGGYNAGNAPELSDPNQVGTASTQSLLEGSLALAQAGFEVGWVLKVLPRGGAQSISDLQFVDEDVAHDTFDAFMDSLEGMVVFYAALMPPHVQSLCLGTDMQFLGSYNHPELRGLERMQDILEFIPDGKTYIYSMAPSSYMGKDYDMRLDRLWANPKCDGIGILGYIPFSDTHTTDWALMDQGIVSGELWHYRYNPPGAGGKSPDTGPNKSLLDDSGKGGVGAVVVPYDLPSIRPKDFAAFATGYHWSPPFPNGTIGATALFHHQFDREVLNPVHPNTESASAWEGWGVHQSQVPPYSTWLNLRGGGYYESAFPLSWGDTDMDWEMTFHLTFNGPYNKDKNLMVLGTVGPLMKMRVDYVANTAALTIKWTIAHPTLGEYEILNPLIGQLYIIRIRKLGDTISVRVDDEPDLGDMPYVDIHTGSWDKPIAGSSIRLGYDVTPETPDPPDPLEPPEDPEPDPEEPPESSDPDDLSQFNIYELSIDRLPRTPRTSMTYHFDESFRGIRSPYDANKKIFFTECGVPSITSGTVDPTEPVELRPSAVPNRSIPYNSSLVVNEDVQAIGLSRLWRAWRDKPWCGELALYYEDVRIPELARDFMFADSVNKPYDHSIMNKKAVKPGSAFIGGCDDEQDPPWLLPVSEFMLGRIPRAYPPVDLEDCKGGQICSRSRMWYPQRLVVWKNDQPYGFDWAPED